MVWHFNNVITKFSTLSIFLQSLHTASAWNFIVFIDSEVTKVLTIFTL